MNTLSSLTCILQFLLIAFSSFTICTAQEMEKEIIIKGKNFHIELDASNPINAAHQYIDFFSTQDDNYIKELYANNISNMMDHTDLMNPAKLVKNSDGNNSLVFGVHRNGEFRLDTLRNTVHPHSIGYNDNDYCIVKNVIGKIRAKFATNNLTIKSIEGRLPKGGMAWLSPKRKRIEFGILVPDINAQVSITIKNKAGKVIDTIVDEKLSKGWNNYEWKRGYYPKGKYKITYTMNGQSMSQMFKC